MILITGGLGHIGSATVRALHEMGEECVLIQRRSPVIPDGRFATPVAAVQADVKDLGALRAIGRDYTITGIIHMAGSMPWPPSPDEAPVDAAREALGGLFNIIQVAQEWGVQRVSLASTIGVYAGLPHTGALSEELPVPLTAPHVIPTFKRISELLGNHLAKAADLEIIHLRISGAWGPLGHLPNFAFPAPQFVYAAATGTPVDLSGVGGRLQADDGLDLCYVYDLGRATALLQTAASLTYGTYNVGAGRMTTNTEVINVIKSVVPEFEVELESGSSMPPSYLDITRLHQDTGYEPEWDVERSVADYIAYFRAGNPQ
ncbi:MAG: NAD-dependent epimerase/dehydratase family protein [Solirubrobacteraceae bacterium]